VKKKECRPFSALPPPWLFDDTCGFPDPRVLAPQLPSLGAPAVSECDGGGGEITIVLTTQHLVPKVSKVYDLEEPDM
jgi:hypothetical protein